MKRKTYAKHKPYKKHINNKIGICMIILGIVAMAALFLPLKYWTLLLSGSLIFFGCTLIK